TIANASGSRATLAMKLVPRSSIAQSLCGIERGRDDRHIAGAAADVATEKLAQVLLGRVGDLAKIPVERHQDAGGAEAALQRVMAAERFLQHREAAGFGREALYGADRGA